MAHTPDQTFAGTGEQTSMARIAHGWTNGEPRALLPI
jgi:hypothetical protein